MGLLSLLGMVRFLLGAVFLFSVTDARAYHHHDSKIRYQEFSAAVFEQARRENKPVFLNISAVWCYWCKYFDQHTLETNEVADYLNRHFLSVFVDSDLRMDVTRHYARGWPMTVLFDPQGRVRLSFPGALKKNDFMDLLRRVESEIRGGKEMVEIFKAQPVAQPSAAPAGKKTYRRLVEGLLRYFDEHTDRSYGGFGQGRKFPQSRFLAFLLELKEVTNHPTRATLLQKNLEGIERGIFDTRDGGFFRYAERRDWTEAHTEKMLYVNVPLASVFQKASEIFSQPRYAKVSDLTLAYVLHSLYDSKHGGFYGSQNADPHYYSLSAEKRSGTPKPGINKDKLTAWNAEAIVSLYSMAQRKKRRDLEEAALLSLEFLLKNLVTEHGMYHIYRDGLGKGFLLGQLEANAWSSLAFLEGFRQTKRPRYLAAAEKILAYLRSDYFDQKRGVFVERKTLELPLSGRVADVPLDANGLLAEAHLLAFRSSGKREYRDTAERVLQSLSGAVGSLLSDNGENNAQRTLSDAVFFLKAYRRMIGGSRQ